MFRIMILIVAIMSMAGIAEASVWGSVKGFFDGKILELVLTGIAAALTFGLTKLYNLSNSRYNLTADTFESAGKFFEVLGAAVDDRKITKEELAAIIAQGKAVFSLYEETPEQFKPDTE